MNYLKICQEVNRFGGFQGTLASVSTSGYQETLVAAVAKSWIEVQNERPDWSFLKRITSISLTSAATAYTLTDIFGSTSLLGTWNREMILYNYIPLSFIPYDSYVQIDQTLVTGPPEYFTIRPEDDALLFNALDGDYAISAHYYRKPQVLVNNTDIPILPEKHHWIIVYTTLLEMGVFISNPELYQRYSVLLSKAMGQLMREQNIAKKVKVRGIC